MENKVGEIFEVKYQLKVVEQDGCSGCFFENVSGCMGQDIECRRRTRPDNKSVIFIKQ